MHVSIPVTTSTASILKSDHLPSLQVLMANDVVEANCHVVDVG